ncbi:alpha-12 glucosyltransferase alg-10, partial [Pyrenophora tritici-repentis]
MVSVLESLSLPGALAFLVSVTATWSNYVSNIVPDAYLDEFFHVPQAKKYCEGDYSWDPKITTPPGLYVVSKILKPLLGCDTRALRLLNAQAICLIFIMSYAIQRLLRVRNNPSLRSQSKSGEGSLTSDPTFLPYVHSALNIALFPPLFFFSALYYTDVMSTLTVLFSYAAYLESSRSNWSLLRNLGFVLLGIVALFFRQTNIFWVAVFPAGLAVVDVLKKDAPPATSNSHDITSVLQDSWSEGKVVDCPVQDAGPQDVAMFVISVVVAAIRKPLIVLKVIVPYVILLVLFAGFVFWNGSVVLGDKSAHTATIHLPQMLYIWPYFAFFSAPLLLGPLLRPVVPLMPERYQKIFDEHLNVSTYGFPSLLVFLLAISCDFLVVHFNTIIHPYTLADNRHYVFYVFKMIRLYPALKYLAVPVYCICGWLVIQTLASPLVNAPPKTKDISKDTVNHHSCQISF